MQKKKNEIDVSAILFLIEANTQFHFEISSQVNFFVGVSIAKIVRSKIELKTNLPRFEESQAGQNLISNAKMDLEDILLEYGVIPSLGIGLEIRF